MNILDKTDIFNEKRRELLGALISLATVSSNTKVSDETTKMLMNGLISLHPMSGESDDELNTMIGKVHAQKNKISSELSKGQGICTNTEDYDFPHLLMEAPQCQNLKEKILLTLLETPVNNVDVFYRAIAILGTEADLQELSDIYNVIQKLV